MYETTTVSAEVVNQAFINKIESGMVKEAEEAASAYIRNRLYEQGVLRRLWEPQTLTADQLDPTENDDDKPSIVVEREPDGRSATFVPFKGTGNRHYFYGRRFRVPMGKIEAERVTKSKFELLNIRMSIMDWLKENQVKAVQHEEDSLFMETCEDIVTQAGPSQSVDASALPDFKLQVVAGLKAMNSLMLPVGKMVMHRNTFMDSLALKTDTIGYAPQEKRFNEGVEGEDSFLGYPVVTTLKSDIVRYNEIWLFPPQEFFAKFYMLQDATLFLKQEADMISFHTYEAPGFGIGNTKGVVKVTLNDSTAADGS